VLSYLSILWAWLVKSEEIQSAKNRSTTYAGVALSYFGLERFIAGILPIKERVCWALGHFIYVWVGQDEQAPPKELKSIRIGKFKLKWKGAELILKIWLVASKKVID